ncbi:S24 family peptidase [Novosphingobium sp.]|uniref:S24 family peptidase n=1 Tax=Novosphingobium sp. TaxID=1874826 RepID=UPI003D0E6173
MNSDSIIAGLKRLGVPHDEIAAVIGRDRTAATKMLSGIRSVKGNEIEPLSALIAKYENEAGESQTVRNDALDALYHDGLLIDYVPVEMLPTYAGAGAGGTADGDRRRALLPRSLIQELRATPDDLLVIEIRGDSMTPDFKQGDQIVIDKRDRDARHSGPFAIFDGDTYILKNVEHLPGGVGKLRVFSTKVGLTDWIANVDEVQIEGRPVWYARRI